MSYMSTHLHCSRQCVGKQNKDPCHNGGKQLSVQKEKVELGKWTESASMLKDCIGKVVFEWRLAEI